MKKIYFPDMDVLYQMQEVIGGDNTYKYILAKTIEAIIVEGINYPSKGILKNAFKYIKENPEIVNSICMLYPSEVMNAEIAQYEPHLCSQLLYSQPDNSIYSLDNLANFSDIVNFNSKVVSDTVGILSKKLNDCPQYRFAYRKSPLLESIFSVDKEVFKKYPGIIDDLTVIEPAYGVVYDECYSSDLMKIKQMCMGVSSIIDRYAIQKRCGKEYQGKDILTNQDQNVKRLIRTIEHNKYNLY